MNEDRREFIKVVAMAAVGSGAAALMSPANAMATNTHNQKQTSYGQGPFQAEGLAAYSPTSSLRLMKFQRRALGPNDVAIQIHYCGICHSDIHTILGDWGQIQYPQIVGHEITGEVVAIGSSVRKFNLGARVGVGTMVNSCRHCSECEAGYENYCLNGDTQTYGSIDKDGTVTQGGYSNFIVVDENYVIKIPNALDLADAAPLLCAGVTVYSPLRKWGVSQGKKVAIVGMGGLGHLAVKFATAMGANVTVFTTSSAKVQDSKRFGATDVLINEDGADFSKFKNTFDFALDTVADKHDLDRFVPLLKHDAAYCRVGLGKDSDSNEIGQMNLVSYRIALVGSNTGGIRETQDMVEFCALNKIKPEITIVSPNEVDEAWKNVLDKKVRYRYVIDMKA